MAMLLVLKTLTPVERAVFVLREVFELDYAWLPALARPGDTWARRR